MKNLTLSELSFAVFDFETTGFYADSGDEIIEIGAILVENGAVSEHTYQTLVNPGRPIPAASTAVHGIKDEDVGDAPPLSVVLPKFYRFITSRVLVAQNAKFDMSFLLRALERHQLPFRQGFAIDTIGISKMLFPYETSHNLDAIMARLGILRSGDRHRSLDDARYTAQALVEFMKLLQNQGITALPQIESAFIRADAVYKPKAPTTKALF